MTRVLRRRPSIFVHLAAAGSCLLPGEATAQSSDLPGTWLGTLSVGGTELRLVFNVEQRDDGGLAASLDSPDQGAMGLPVDEVLAAGDSVRFRLPALGAEYAGRRVGPDSLTGEWRQSGQVLPLTLARSDDADVAPRRRPQDPAPPFPYRVEEVAYDNPAAEGVRLAGTLTVPPEGGPHPAVLLVSGSGPQNRDEELMGHRPFHVLADHLTRRGIAVLRVDDRGVGESTGVFGSADSRDFASDALAGVRFLAGRDDIDAGAVGIVGHSEGGLVGPLAAVEGDDVDFLVLLAGPGVPGDSILLVQGAAIRRASGVPEERVARLAGLQGRLNQALRSTDPGREAIIRETAREMVAAEAAGEEIPDEVIEQQIARLTGPWFDFFLRHDPAPVLRRLDVPTLALFGSLDLQVPPDINAPAVREALASSPSPAWDVRVLVGLNHLFQTATTGVPGEYSSIEETMAPMAMDQVATWILEVTGRAPTGP